MVSPKSVYPARTINAMTPTMTMYSTKLPPRASRDEPPRGVRRVMGVRTVAIFGSVSAIMGHLAVVDV
jgi:hypothetical protein